MKHDTFMREKRPLRVVALSPDITVICNESLLAIRGKGPEGFDYICGGCQAIIAENVAPGQLWDLAFKCASCGTLGITPSSPPGTILPRQTIFMPPGEYPFSLPFELEPNIVIVGMAAVARCAVETGIGISPPETVKLDRRWLLSLETRARTLLGEHFEGLIASFQRGQNSKTPPSSPHRLMKLLHEVNKSTATLYGPSPKLDTGAIMELHCYISLLERWKNHPVWQEILPSLQSADSLDHALITAWMAALLSELGNPVGLQASSDQRSADVKLVLTLQEHMVAEVKAPQKLKGPCLQLDENTADNVVRKCLKKAGSGKRGQLNENHTGLLIIGGFHVPRHELTLLEQAADGILKRQGCNKKHLIGICLVSVGLTVDDIICCQLAPVTSLKAISNLTVLFSRNPNYRGQIQLQMDDHCNSKML